MCCLRPLVLAVAAITAGMPATATAQTIPLDALLRGARIHYSGGRIERAKEQFEKALEQYGEQVDNPTLAQIHIWLGLSEAQLRSFAEAADHFQKALAADSSSVGQIRQDEQKQYWAWTALINTARKAYNRGSYDSSLTYALVALEINPEKPGTYSLLANSYSALGQYDEMLATAQELLRLDAESPDGFSLIGLYYLQKPDSLWPDEMKQARWDSCGHYYNQGISIYETRFENARKTLGDILRIADPDRLDEVTVNLVEKSRAGNQEELKRYIEQDLDAAKQLSEIAQFASQLFYAANNLNVSSSRAGSAMLRASSETEGDNSTQFKARAESLFNKALEYDPYDFTAMFNLGIVQYQSQQDSLAQTTFQRVIDGAVVPFTELPDDWQNTLLELITPDAARTSCLSLDGSTLASIDSILATKGHLAGGYAWLYFPKLRDKDQFTEATAEDAADMFLSLRSPQALENIYLLLGVSQTGIGLSLVEAKQKDAAKEKFDQAIATLKMVIVINPQNAEAYQNLVHCYRETNQKKKAEQAYLKYKELSE